MRQREERLMKMAATENGDCVFFYCVFLANSAEGSLLHWHGFRVLEWYI